MEAQKFYLISYGLMLSMTLPVFIITGVVFFVKAIQRYLEILKARKRIPALSELVKIVEGGKDKKELNRAISFFQKHFSDFPSKESIDNPKEATQKMEFLHAMCKNTALDESYITTFEKALVDKNAEYKDEITQTCHSALQMR